MGATIAQHNAKILKNADRNKQRKPPTCNCRTKEDCPIPGACNQDGVVYQATIKNNAGGKKHSQDWQAILRRGTTNIKRAWRNRTQKIQQHFPRIFGKNSNQEGSLKSRGK